MKFRTFYLSDIKKIVKILEQVEDEYRDEAPKHAPERQVIFLATARGASIAKGRILDYLRKRYKIGKL